MKCEMAPTPAAVEAAITRIFKAGENGLEAGDSSQSDFDMLTKDRDLIVEALRSRQPPTDEQNFNKYKEWIEGQCTPALSVELEAMNPSEYLDHEVEQFRQYLCDSGHLEDDPISDYWQSLYFAIKFFKERVKLDAQSPARVNRELLDALKQEVKYLKGVAALIEGRNSNLAEEIGKPFRIRAAGLEKTMNKFDASIFEPENFTKVGKKLPPLGG